MSLNWTHCCSNLIVIVGEKIHFGNECLHPNLILMFGYTSVIPVKIPCLSLSVHIIMYSYTFY